jgi:flagellar hook assembly protein FlgD
VATANVDNIGIVPNPYRGASEYEVSSQEERARFTNLPERATIRIYTLDGTLVNTLQKDGPGATLDWNLENQDGLSIASGIYLVHVTAFEDGNEIGQKVLKFAVVRKQRKLNIF